MKSDKHTQAYDNKSYPTRQHEMCVVCGHSLPNTPGICQQLSQRAAVTLNHKEGS